MLYQAKLTAEPYATHKRQLELRRELTRETRQGLVYFDVTNSLRAGESARGGEPGRLTILSGHAWHYDA